MTAPRDIPLDDFDVNAVGTLNLLEAARRFRPEAVFIFMSTNKVYGDAPNELPLDELRRAGTTRVPRIGDGIAEDLPDRSQHALHLRGVEGRGRRHGAGVRPLFRPQDGLPSRRLPDRAESFRRRAARVSELSRQGAVAEAANTRSSATRASRSATNPQHRRRRRVRGLRRKSASRRGVQPRRRDAPTACSILECSRCSRTGSAGTMTLEVRRPEPAGRPHLLHQRSVQDEAHYPAWSITRSLPAILDEMVAAELAAGAPPR